MIIGMESRKRNGMCPVAEEDVIELGRNGGFHDVKVYEERRCSVEEG